MFSKIIIAALSYVMLGWAANAAQINNAGKVERIEISPSVKITAPNSTHIPLIQTAIDIQTNGSATVEEKFFLMVSDKDQSYSFSRNIPKIIKTPFGNRNINFEVAKVIVDKTLVPFSLIEHSAYDTLILPEHSKFTPGIHIFSIGYKISHAIDNTGKNDVFLWGIFNSGWQQAVARIILTVNHPGTITPIGQNLMLNGKQDSVSKNITPEDADVESSNTFNFVRKEILYPNNDLIFLETFAKDSFTSYAPKQSLSLLRNSISEINLTILIYIVGFIFVLGYFAVVSLTASTEKRKFSKSFQNNKLNILFSPAGLRMFLGKSFDSKAILALILSLADKGVIQVIEKTPGKFTLMRLVNTGKKLYLSMAEKLFISYILPKGTVSLDLDTQVCPKLVPCRRILEHSLQDEYDKQFFKINYSYFVFSLVIALLTMITAGLSSDNQVWTITTSVITGLSVFVDAEILLNLIVGLLTPAYKGKIIRLSILAVLSLVFTGIAALYTFKLATGLNSIATVSLVLMMVTIVIFYQVLKSKNKLGKAVQNYVSMCVANVFANTPLPAYFTNYKDKAIVAFSDLLPFAIASDKAAVHLNRFSSILNTHPSLEWYQGNEPTSSIAIANFIARLDKQINKNCGFLNIKIQQAKQKA